MEDNITFHIATTSKITIGIVNPGSSGESESYSQNISTSKLNI